MPLDAPFKLGPFTVDSDGGLTPSTPDRFPSFRVAWRGHVVQARLTAAEPEGGTLALQAVLGRVPSTGRAEAPGTLPRQAAFAAVRALPATLPAGWRVALRPDHCIVAEAEVNLPPANQRRQPGDRTHAVPAAAGPLFRSAGRSCRRGARATPA